MKPSLVIFLHSDAYDRVYQAASLMLTASSMGWPCHLFLFYQALAGFMSGEWESPRPEQSNSTLEWESRVKWVRERAITRGFDEADLPSVHEIIERARTGEGGLTLYACSASVRILEFDPAEVRRKVNEIVGLPTMLQIAESSRFAWYI